MHSTPSAPQQRWLPEDNVALKIAQPKTARKLILSTPLAPQKTWLPENV